jgi:blocked-early-in-transport protein 1
VGQRNRAQGFGTPTPTSSGRSTPFYGQSSFGSRQRSAEEVESQNDEAIEGLTAKVKLLKDVCPSADTLLGTDFASPS